MRTLLVLACLLCTPHVGHCATYYLNPATGNDINPGTSAGIPWKTIHKVKTTVGPGDIVNVLAGNYIPSQYQGEGGTPEWNDTQSKGTAGSPIIIQAQPGATVVFDGQQQAYWMTWRAAVNTNFYVVVQNLTFQNYAAAVMSIGSGAGQTSRVGILNCRFQNIAQGSASAIGVGTNADKILFRGNWIYNSGDPSLSGYGGPIQQHGIYITEGNTSVVLDGNYIEKISGFGIHYWGHDNYSLPITQTIVRRNTIVNAHWASMIFAGTTFSKSYIYHNTMYSEPVPFPAIDSSPAQYLLTWHNGLSSTTMRVMNNLGAGSVVNTAAQADQNSDFNGSLAMNYNFWQNVTDANKVYSWDGVNYTLAGFRAATPYEDNALVGSPLFVDAAARTFTLQPTSPAIDAGTPLTTTVGSGTGTTVTVADAGYFMDGFGLVAGDQVVIGSTPVTLTSVNYATNVLTVTPSLTWSTGQAVSLPYNGTAPDMGAFEASGPATTTFAGLQAHWKLDETSGTSAVDSTDFAHHGTHVGPPSITAGRVGPRALTFDGTTSYVTIPDPGMQVTTMTLALWAKPGDFAVIRDMLTRGDCTTTNFFFETDTSGHLSFGWNTPTYYLNSGVVLTAGQWAYLVATYDGTTVRVYRNGALLASGTATGPPPTMTSITTIGRGGSCANYYWNGSLDDVRVYNVALTPAEILQLYQTTAGKRSVRMLRR
jgi:hypothetical protein